MAEQNADIYRTTARTIEVERDTLNQVIRIFASRGAIDPSRETPVGSAKVFHGPKGICSREELPSGAAPE